jgi:hypothetical protein
MAEHDDDAATGGRDEDSRAVAVPAGSPSAVAGDSTDHRRLTPFGVAMEKAREDSGLSTDAFMRARRLNVRTWRRLLYGLPSANDLPPRDTTVLRYGRAVGLSDATAMRLADESFGPGAEDLSELGALLEKARRALGQSIRTFVDERGLSYSTYKRLIRKGLYRYQAARYPGTQTAADAWPPPTTVREYAAAAGVDLELAERLARQDRLARLEAGDPGAPAT